MRTPIYPAAEALIQTKKLRKYEDQQEAAKTFEEKQAKGNAKRSRIATPTSKTQITVCSSCKNSGHTSARSKDCPNHDPTMNELIQTKLGNNHQRYTVSLPLKSFFKKENESSFENSLLKIKALSSFLRDVTFKAQVFVNYYILKHSKDLSNDIFKQNFWYSVCRVVYKKLSVEDFQKQYSKMPSLADTWNELNNREGVKLTVEMDGISNYGQVISTACETISTSNAFPFILDGVFSSQPTTVEVPDDILPPTEQDDKHKIQGLIANLTLEIRNRLPSFPVTKETLNKAPFDIMPASRHMLSKYENLIAKNPNPQTQESEQKPHKKSNTKTKKQKGKNPEVKKQTEKKFTPPRVFSLFPNPGLRWRFIKIDSQNLKSIFPDVAPKRNHNETLYEYTL
ncbi:hypothetical protein MFLAVUS_006110 [Mucor flavus]|uniref:Uncharacterized protein n=1 Tax=Mucor flavus TaxID=439312 RepID=A0ABP9Z0N0_9FUNG